MVKINVEISQKANKKIKEYQFKKGISNKDQALTQILENLRIGGKK